jgi:hypothetical protein
VTALAGCGALPEPPPPAASAAPVARPSASVAPNWVQSLTFSGDLSGSMSRLSPPAVNQHSECSGKNSKSGGTWASTLIGPVGAEVFGVVVVANGYRGPGGYDQSKTAVQVHSLDYGRAWGSLSSDPVTFTIGPDEESGSIDATLTNLTTGKTKLKVAGRWSCKT